MQMQPPLVPGGFQTRHGFPPGVRFLPTELELVSILSHRVRGIPLPPPVATIFHDISVLSYHPKELHEMYKQDEEERYIYFFSHRQLQKLLPADERQKVPRPVRVAKNGGWKASGPAKPLRSPPGRGRRFVVGRIATMVFYDNVVNEKGVKTASLKTNWAMNEITIPRDQRLSSMASTTRFYDLALYRLYSLEKKAGDAEAETSAGTASAEQAPENVVSDDLPAPCTPPAGQPFGVSTATPNQPPLAVGASTSAWMPPPPQQQQQHRLNIQHAQYCYPHDQYALFGAAQGQQQLHGAMPVHHTSIGPPAHLLPLVRPPAPAPVPRSPYLMPPPSTRPPAYLRPPAEQLPPATPTVTHGRAGQQQAGHFGAATCPPYIMQPSTLPPAGVRPPVAQLPPATPGTRGGAGQEEAGHHFGVTCSPCSAPAAGSSGSPPAQQHATAATTTTEPPPPEDVVVPDAQENGMEVPDWLPDLEDLDDDDFRFCFTMEELIGYPSLDDVVNEPLPLPAGPGTQQL